MMRLMVMVCSMLLLNACVAHDQAYYRLHPEVLQQAMNQCPQKQPSGLNCDQLAKITDEIKDYAYELQMNPQAFGRKILSLQEELATQKAGLKQNPQQPELKRQIENNEQRLAQYLAIVRWLESPEG